MINSTQLYNQLKDLSQRHANLKKKFGDFFAAAGYLSSDQSVIQGITFEDHLDENYFNVTFCGEPFQFRFSLALDQTGSSRGALSCFGVDPVCPSKQKLILAFTFSPSGVADIEKPDDINEKIAVHDDVGAIYLICHCIHTGLTR